MGEAQGKAMRHPESTRAPTATPELRAIKPTVLPSPLCLDAKSSGHSTDFSDWSFPPSDPDFDPASPVLSSDLGRRAAKAVFCSGQPRLRAEPGSKHPRNCFIPAARVPSHDIAAVDWSGAGLPFPAPPRANTTRAAAVPVSAHICKPPAPLWKIRSTTRQVAIQHVVAKNQHMRATRHLQQPKARGSKRTP
jgi:hypothetical protein